MSHLRLHVGRQLIVDDLSFQLNAGERVCLLGPSGSGKSMTASAILGISPPSVSLKGEIRINGMDVSHIKAAQRPVAARAGMVFQDTHAALNPLVTVGMQLREPFMRFHGLSKRDAHQAAIDLLARLMIAEPDKVVCRSSAELSGGQRQRICLALALACKPSLIVADEPTTALDVLTQMEVLHLLKECTGTADTPALLFISHDMTAAAQLCERVVIIDEGRLVESAALDTVMSNPQHRFSQELVAAIGDRAFPHRAEVDDRSVVDASAEVRWPCRA
ncbi:ABC transporter ATP-binding protein [Halomonas binhaiensis]|uniref:ABC transporter ATP-binding protein n=1 Tax=Halomonas binhaiensis TaxID=2562282 RepID=A0A5C1NLC3_9GAMM|nr:ABC transporter ATP-binding protein [Halomonas binhaiensis]